MIMDSFLEKVIKKDCLRRYGLSVTDQAAFSPDYRSPKTFRTSLLIRHFAQGHGQKHVIPISPHLEHNFVSGAPLSDLFLEHCYILDLSVVKLKDYVACSQPGFFSRGVRVYISYDCSCILTKSEVCLLYTSRCV